MLIFAVYIVAGPVATMLAMKGQLLRWQEAAGEDGKVDVPF
jgi:hypothetical protein